MYNVMAAILMVLLLHVGIDRHRARLNSTVMREARAVDDHFHTTDKQIMTAVYLHFLVVLTHACLAEWHKHKVSDA